MVLEKPLQGKFVNLRSVTEDDAEFTLGIRNNQKFCNCIPRLNITIEQQKLWIQKQRQCEGDYFFVVRTNLGKPIGVMSLYDVKNGEAESGRLLMIGEYNENIEASLILFSFGFNQLNLATIVGEVYRENKRALRYAKLFGGKVTNEEKVIGGRECFCIEYSKKDFFKEKEKVEKILYRE